MLALQTTVTLQRGSTSTKGNREEERPQSRSFSQTLTLRVCSEDTGVSLNPHRISLASKLAEEPNEQLLACILSASFCFGHNPELEILKPCTLLCLQHCLKPLHSYLGTKLIKPCDLT